MPLGNVGLSSGPKAGKRPRGPTSFSRLEETATITEALNLGRDGTMPPGKVVLSSGSEAGKRTAEFPGLNATDVIYIAKYMDIPSLLNALEADRALTSPISQEAGRLLIKRESELANELLARVDRKDEGGVKQILKLLPVLRNPAVKERIPNHKNREGDPLLFIALKQHTFEIAKMLIDYGADVTSFVTVTGITPLMLVCRDSQEFAEKNSEIAKGILERIVEIKQDEVSIKEYINKADNTGRTSLWFACRNNCVDIATYLISKGADINKATDRGGTTPLWIACNHGHSQIVRLLLSQNEIDVNCADHNGKTPLNVASMKGCDDIVHLLVDKNAEIDKADIYGKTPLNVACSSNRPGIVHFLIRNGADINKADNTGRTPFWFACQNDYFDIATDMISKGADINKANDEGETPLWIACDRGHSQIVHLLLSQNEIDANFADHNGKTPLNVASMWGYDDIVSLLVSNKADINKADNTGQTPLWIACEYEDLKIVRFLIENGADINKADYRDRTPLMIAERNLNYGIKNLLEAKLSEQRGAVDAMET